MNIRLIRRIAALTAAVLASAASFADAPPPPQPVFVNGPNTGVTASYQTEFSWANTLADSYTLKFKVVETGQALKHVVSAATCGAAADCEVAYQNTPLFSAVEDGQTVRWRIVARYGVVKTKSAPRTLTANTVQPPSLLIPATATIVEDGDPLSWDSHPANSSYTLIVKVSATGERVIKTVLASNDCLLMCGVDPHDAGDLTLGTLYVWRVKVKGFNGDKAKSAAQTFTTPFDLLP